MSEDIWNCIKEGLDKSADISETIDLIELMINFVSFGKQRPQQTIKNYMHEVLKYPISKPIISPVVSFQHLFSISFTIELHLTTILEYRPYLTGVHKNNLELTKKVTPDLY